MLYDVRNALLELGIRADAFSVDVVITPITTTDPEVITITYHSLYEVSPYIKNTVKIEISGRSMVEPIEKKAINAAIDAQFPKAPFAEQPFEVNAVIPERTFLEKVFLLHEEFKKDCLIIYAQNLLNAPNSLNGYQQSHSSLFGLYKTFHCWL